jgi:hypothetical protein
VELTQSSRGSLSWPIRSQPGCYRKREKGGFRNTAEAQGVVIVLKPQLLVHVIEQKAPNGPVILEFRILVPNSRGRVPISLLWDPPEVAGRQFLPK